MHDAYLGQPWLTSNGIEVDWTTGKIHLKPDITIRGIQKKEKQLSLMSACQFKKVMQKEQAFLAVIRPKEPETDKKEPLPIDPKVQNLLTEYADVFPDELPKVFAS